MQLNILEQVEKQLKKIIDNAIDTGKINSDKLRMIIISPTSNFDTLKVTYNNEWEKYYYESNNDSKEIGYISIHQWLDVADNAFETRDKLDPSFIDLATTYTKKYSEEKYSPEKPVLNFDHIKHPLYKNYLICLREELITQIEKAIKNVASSYTQKDFKHVVGFVSHKLTFVAEEDTQILGFNHPNGIGPFHNVMLTLPNSKLTYPYLKFYTSGFYLFYPESNIYEGPEEESNIYTYDIKDISYIHSIDSKNSKIVFRLQNEFEDWKLNGGHINQEFGDLPEEALFNDFKEFTNRFPDKMPQVDTIPHPINEEIKFKKWITFLIDNNLSINFRYDNEERIYSYGEKAFRKVLELLPNTHKSYQSLQLFLASKLFSEGRHKETVEIFTSIKKLSDHDKVHLLENLYYLDNKKAFDHCFDSIENKREKTNALLPKWLYNIHLYSNQKEKLLELKQELMSYIDENRNYARSSRASMALTKLYTVLNDKENALLSFKEIDFSYSLQSDIFQKEFTNVSYMQDAYANYLVKEKEKREFKDWVKTSSLIIPEKRKKEPEKIVYEDCYHLIKEIEDVSLVWAVPISSNQFVGVSKDEELFLGEITDTNELKKHTSIQLHKDKRYEYTYCDTIIYVSDDEGIHRYQVQDSVLISLDGVIKNKMTIPKYGGLTVTDNYLYICNNDYLEIFDLSDLNAHPVSSELFIESGYSLHVQENMLVVGAGAGLVILIDIENKSKPQYLSTIKEDMTPGKMHVEFIDNYLISRSVIDITNPKKPKYVCHTWDTLAPIYYFTEKPATNLYSTEGEFLFKKLDFTQNDTQVVNWLENLNAEKEDYKRFLGNLATLFLDDTVIGFTEYDILILQKTKTPGFEKQEYDIQKALNIMVKECFEYLIENHPDFNFGKIVFECERDRGIKLSFHECSSFAVLPNFYDRNSELPTVQTDFSFYNYFKEELNLEFDSITMKVVYDLNAIINELIQDSRFNQMASKHVSIIINNESEYLHFPDNYWKPYRKVIETEVTETVASILRGGNKNLIQKLENSMINDDVVFKELLKILNTKSVQEKEKKTSSMFSMKQLDNTQQNIKPTYIRSPLFRPENKNDVLEDVSSLKQEAFRIICTHPDKTIVKNIVLNGIKYGILKPVLKQTPEKLNVNRIYLSHLAKNSYNLWNEFSEDIEIKTFLINFLNEAKTFLIDIPNENVLDKDYLKDNNITANIASRYQIYDHPSIQIYMRDVIKVGHLDYYSYKGIKAFGKYEIDISQLPIKIIQNFKEQLFKIYAFYEDNTDNLNWEINNAIIPTCDMLIRLGYEEFPEKVVSGINAIKKETEQYDDDLLDNMFDDDNDTDETFLLQLYRKQQAKQMLKNCEEGEISPIWNMDLAPEPYKKSWYNFIDILINQGEEVFGENFKDMFIKKLCVNISKDETYNNDRLLAFNFIHYTYKYIHNNPTLASYAEDLVKVMNQHKEKFTEQIDLYKIKEKSKFALLQAAWNDLKDEKYDLAAQKSDGLLALDSKFGQVFFLKARLLWLEKGIPAYLEKQEEFIEKASHDAAALARLYNLTGCALDIEKRYEEAIPYFKKAALTVPRDLMYTANIAEIHYKLKQPKEAVKYAKRVTQQGYSSDMMSEILANNGVIDKKTRKN